MLYTYYISSRFHRNEKVAGYAFVCSENSMYKNYILLPEEGNITGLSCAIKEALKHASLNNKEEITIVITLTAIDIGNESSEYIENIFKSITVDSGIAVNFKLTWMESKESKEADRLAELELKENKNEIIRFSNRLINLINPTLKNGICQLMVDIDSYYVISNINRFEIEMKNITERRSFYAKAKKDLRNINIIFNDNINNKRKDLIIRGVKTFTDMVNNLSY